MTHGELRAHLSYTIAFRGARSDLVENMQLPPPLTTVATAALLQATPDTLQQGIERMGSARHYASFINDTATVHTPRNIHDAVNRSVLDAYIVFGFPDGDALLKATLDKLQQRIEGSHLPLC
jgi:hypothetical protein